MCGERINVMLFDMFFVVCYMCAGASILAFFLYLRVRQLDEKCWGNQVHISRMNIIWTRNYDEIKNLRSRLQAVNEEVQSLRTLYDSV